MPGQIGNQERVVAHELGRDRGPGAGGVARAVEQHQGLPRATLPVHEPARLGFQTLALEPGRRESAEPLAIAAGERAFFARLRRRAGQGEERRSPDDRQRNQKAGERGADG